MPTFKSNFLENELTITYLVNSIAQYNIDVNLRQNSNFH